MKIMENGIIGFKIWLKKATTLDRTLYQFT
jgi:hypothetical protein